jgi:hypothetical protein
LSWIAVSMLKTPRPRRRATRTLQVRPRPENMHWGMDSGPHRTRTGPEDKELGKDMLP